MSATASPRALEAQSPPEADTITAAPEVALACRGGLSRTEWVARLSAAGSLIALQRRGYETTPWHLSRDSWETGLRDPSGTLHVVGTWQLSRPLRGTDCPPEMERRRNRERLALALGIGLVKEVADGWVNGFAVSDLAANAVGATWGYLQQEHPRLLGVQPAMSVVMRGFARQQPGTSPVTDYQMQIWWLNVTPSVLRAVPPGTGGWHDALRLNLGRRAWYDNPLETQKRLTQEWLVGLDLDPRRLGVRPGTAISHTSWRHTMAMLRWPTPAIVIRDGAIRGVSVGW